MKLPTALVIIITIIIGVAGAYLLSLTRTHTLDPIPAAGAQPPMPVAQWEYAELSFSTSGLKWEDATQEISEKVSEKLFDEFAKKLKLGPVVKQNTTVLLNLLAAQGWEVVNYNAIPAVLAPPNAFLYSPQREVWLLRRPKK